MGISRYSWAGDSLSVINFQLNELIDNIARFILTFNKNADKDESLNRLE
ncbi:MAG: hypothetical protein ACSLEL_03760 [Candidatus Malihini olakiniferum]